MNPTQKSDGAQLLAKMNGREQFQQAAAELLEKDKEGYEKGKYCVVFLDVQRFKAINDLFGTAEGDRLLGFIGEVIDSVIGKGGIYCRENADRFAFLTKADAEEAERQINEINEIISTYDLPFEIVINAGIYVTCGEDISVSSMVDRAIMAQSVIKTSATKKWNFYSADLRNKLLDEQEIIGSMHSALKDGQFIVYYQPQYSHITGMMLGAEALVRWSHPARGLIQPCCFVPIFERNNFITQINLYVFEEVCKFQKMCMDKNYHMVPISTNVSRCDIFSNNFVDKMEEIRKKYDVPVKYLRVEITETDFVGGSAHVNESLRQFHKYGYIVEMDDFGSGYSSLNVLKDVDFDVLKMDMRFLSDSGFGGRAGIIISSVVRMAKWLNLPVIAEGVETVHQADFLKSIGCECIQGFLYERPIPQDKFEELLKGSSVGKLLPEMRLMDHMNPKKFWDPNSLETMIFSNFVGSAAIFEYSLTDKKVEVLRVNENYLREMGMNLTEIDVTRSDPLAVLDEENRKIYIEMLDKAIETGKEQECETWRVLCSDCCGCERVCIRSQVKMIGRSDMSVMFYAMVRNITDAKNRLTEIMNKERRFKVASDQANIYYWEYSVPTKEMRPCNRCMRDLNLPALVRNYPEPAIEQGIFPEDYADMYREWHRLIEAGEPYLEGVIPLTAARVPFIVRYTTEFDETGRPIKAYGSATMVVDN